MRSYGTLFARRTRMAAVVGASRRRSRRVELTVPFSPGTDLAFGISFRVPRSRARKRGSWKRWPRALAKTILVAVAIGAPMLTAWAMPELARVRLALFAEPPHDMTASWAVPDAARPVLQARHLLTTVTTPQPPAVRAYVVAQGETLLSIAARFGITPQTLAYDNGISDSAQVHAGQSLVVPPFDAAVHVMGDGETIAAVASRFGLQADAVRALNGVAFDDSDAAAGRVLVLPVPDAQYPGFRLHLSEPPRVLAPRVRWPAEGVITQLYSVAHTGIDIAAPYGTPIVATDAGTVSFVGYRGIGGLAVCVYLDWGLESCAYHDSASYVEVGQRVAAGQTIAAIGLTGETTGPHVHWEARTNGALVDPLTYAPPVVRPAVGGSTGSTSAPGSP